MCRKSPFLVLLWLTGVTAIYCPETKTRNSKGNCTLSCHKIGELFDDTQATWTVDDDFLNKHHLQNVLDCAKNGETVALNLSKPYVPKTSLAIRTQITIRPPYAPEAAAKATLKCPTNYALMLIENASVVLENIIVENCTFHSHLPFNSIIRLKCSKRGDEAFVLSLLNVDFSNNRTPGGSTGMQLEIPSCMSIAMKGVTFQNSALLKGLMLTYKNDPNKVVALWNASHTLLGIDISSELKDGDRTLVFALPVLKGGNYSIVLRVLEVNSNNVTFSVIACNCLASEFLREDEKRRIRCEGDQYNNRVKNDGNENCPKHANCFGNYVLPLSGYWNSVPCSTHVQECLNRDACRGMKEATFRKEILRAKSDACDLSDEDIENYKYRQCDDGYKGVLCGSCKKNYAKIEASKCILCRYKAWIFVAILLSACTSLYSAWQQIAANLELIRTRWMRRLEMPSREEREANVEQALRRSEHPEEYVARAQYAKEKFALVVQITQNFFQGTSGILSANHKWRTLLPEMRIAVDFVGLNMSHFLKFSCQCLLPASIHMPLSLLSTLLAILAPFFLILCLCMYWLYDSWKLKKPWSYLLKRCMLTAAAILYISYFSFVKLTYSMVGVVDVSDDDWRFSEFGISKLYWRGDTSVSILDSRYVAVDRISQTVLFLVVISPIVLFVVIIWAMKRNALQSEWFRETLGFLIIGFRPKCAFWQCIIILRNISIAFLAVVPPSSFDLFQGTCLSLLFLGCMLVHLKWSPYRTDFRYLNVLEGISLGVCMSTALITTILANQLVKPAFLEIVLAVIVVFINGFSILVYGYHLVTNKCIEIKYTLLLEGVVYENDSIHVVLMKYWQQGWKNARNFLGRLAKIIRSNFSRYRSDINGSASSRLLPSYSDT